METRRKIVYDDDDDINTVNKNHKVLFKTRITHGDEDHTLLKI